MQDAWAPGVTARLLLQQLRPAHCHCHKGTVIRATLNNISDGLSQACQTRVVNLI